ncbi:MAG: EutN/CcmL family microcompartment protein [Candidatus Sumerlaeaceae bacterium]|nr:EutN/CcmL family microcompartment protein [Candidatus Sumerlaeaceae bacterium]
MYLGRVLGNVVSTDKYESYNDRKLLVVQKLDLYRNPSGVSTIAIDYVGAGEGDVVLVGAAPGLASTVFNIPKAPMRELVMGIVDRVDVQDQKAYGISVPE